MRATSLKTTLAALAILWTFAAPPSPAKAAEAEPIILFGIVPQQSATRLAQVWIPVMNRLSQETGLNIRFATTKDIPTFEKCLAKGAYELAYMNPYHYTVFHKRSGYQAFAHQADKRLQGLIVVRTDSPARGLADLDGQSVAFPSPAAFGASILPRAEMRLRKIRFEAKYVKSHDSVYRAVAAGLHAAGGGVKRTFNNIPDDLRAQLRVIHTTDAYTPHAFAARKDLGAETITRISSALLAIGKRDPGLTSQLGMSGFAAARDADWDDVRALDLSYAETQIADEGAVTCRSD